MEIQLVFRTPATRGATASFRRRMRFDERSASIIKNAGFFNMTDAWTAFEDGAAERLVTDLKAAGYTVFVEGAYPAELEKYAA